MEALQDTPWRKPEEEEKCFELARTVDDAKTKAEFLRFTSWKELILCEAAPELQWDLGELNRRIKRLEKERPLSTYPTHKTMSIAREGPWKMTDYHMERLRIDLKATKVPQGMELDNVRLLYACLGSNVSQITPGANGISIIHSSSAVAHYVFITQDVIVL